MKDEVEDREMELRFLLVTGPVLMRALYFPFVEMGPVSSGKLPCECAEESRDDILLASALNPLPPLPFRKSRA